MKDIVAFIGFIFTLVFVGLVSAWLIAFAVSGTICVTDTTCKAALHQAQLP